jgi:hypothetical protein
MDEAGIDVAVTSISTPGALVGDDPRARSLARGVGFALPEIDLRTRQVGAHQGVVRRDLLGRHLPLSPRR